MTTIEEQVLRDGTGQLWWSPVGAAPQAEARAVLRGALPPLASHLLARGPEAAARVRAPQDAAEALNDLADALANLAGPAQLPDQAPSGDLFTQMVDSAALALRAHPAHTPQDKTLVVLQSALPFLASAIRRIGTQAISRRDPAAGVRAAVQALNDVARQAQV